MSGIFIKHAADYVNTFEPYYRETEAVKIFGVGDLETDVFHMQKGITGCFQAVPGKNATEIYYVKCGKVRLMPLDEEPFVMETGEFFAFHDRMDGTLFYILQDTELVCVVNNPIFDMNLGISQNVDKLLSELQEKDGDTRSHGERVRSLVMQMVCHMKEFDGTQLEVLLQATRIHDVGKIRIPLSILIKPGKLTHSEYEIMKKHARYAAEITEGMFDGRMSDIVLHHHEHFDGSGYPDGLSGEEIPLCSRVIAVADAYDAMVITKSYHKGIAPEAALAELRRCAGTQFDPICVEAFCDSIENKDFSDEDDYILQKTESMLADSRTEKIKRDFLSNMSHDMRTPMNAIMNLTALAREDMDDKKKLAEDLDKIDISSRFLLGLVNDILDMAKIESGKLELHPTVCNVKELYSYVDSVILPLCAEKGIQLIWDRTLYVNAVLVDKVRYHQIFFNILSNAVKYSKPGATIWLRAENVHVKKKTLHIEYVFEDQGIGMSEAFQKKLFTPFEREDGGDARMGTGLGLAITKRIVHQMGGTIEVESKSGIGTKIRACLDLALPTSKQMREDELIKQQNEKSFQYYDIKGTHILLAEDHPMNSEIAVRLLHKIGAEVDVARNGEEALEMFTESDLYAYDAILMDIRMPVMDGLTATRTIRGLEREDALKIPIIAMTAEAFEENRKETIDAGMNAHLTKPINPYDLFRTLAIEINARRW